MSKPKGAMGSPYCDGSMTEMFNKAASIMAGEKPEPSKAMETKVTEPVPQVTACPVSVPVSPVLTPTQLVDACLRSTEVFTKDAKKELMSMPSKVGWELEELSASHATFTLKSGQRVTVTA